MAKQQSVQSTNSESRKAGDVQVFNHTSRMLAVGLRVPNQDSRSTNIRIRRVEFLPGNNKVDAETWSKCKESRHVQRWLSRLTHLDRVGRPHKMQLLEEGLYDPEFASEAKLLGDRMHELRNMPRIGV